MTTAQQIGAAIREHREYAGLSGRELARRAEVDQSYVSLIETGRRLPSLEMLYTVASVLGVRAAALLPDKWSER